MGNHTLTDNAIRELAELKRQVQILVDERRQGGIGRVILRRHLARVGATAITAANYAATPDTFGSGTVTLYKRNSDNEFETIKDGQGADLEVTVYNHSDQPSGINTYVWVEQDNLGTWFLEYQPVPKLCQFTLNAALATTDASKGADIETCTVKDLEGDTITVYNHDESGGDYIFEGDSGDYGTAYYDPNNDKWYIIQMECP